MKKGVTLYQVEPNIRETGLNVKALFQLDPFHSNRIQALTRGSATVPLYLGQRGPLLRLIEFQLPLQQKALNKLVEVNHQSSLDHSAAQMAHEHILGFPW